jgi:SAM-dependent methyltransferase
MSNAEGAITEAVRSRYAAVARSRLSNESQGVQAVAVAFGYSAEELRGIPAEANMGLSCGNPVATARLRPGETVVDLGCGGGIDVLLAAKKVGPTGRAVGIDMTDDMLDRARKNAEKATDETGGPLRNVEFFKATIDHMPLADASADCIISNCVINLAPDKRAVFREMARVLRPGGRVAVSDIALKKPLPPEIGQDLLAYVGCIAGAIPIEEYCEGLKEAGFARVEILDSGADLNVYSRIESQVGCCGRETADVPEAVTSLVCCSPAPAASTEGACCTPSKPVAEGEPCCTTAEKEAAIEAGASCCSPTKEVGETPEVLQRLAELARRYNINDYAASVKVFAVKA